MAFGIQHGLQNAIFRGADILLGKLDLVHQRLVLFVGLHFQRLVTVLGDFLLFGLNFVLEFTPRQFVLFE